MARREHPINTPLIVLALIIAVGVGFLFWMPSVGRWILGVSFAFVVLGVYYTRMTMLPSEIKALRRLDGILFCLYFFLVVAGLALTFDVTTQSLGHWVIGITLAVGCATIAAEGIFEGRRSAAQLRDPDSRLAVDGLELSTDDDDWARIVELGKAGRHGAIAQLTDMIIKTDETSTSTYPEPEYKKRAKAALEEIGASGEDISKDIAGEVARALADAIAGNKRDEILGTSTYMRLLSVLANVHAATAVVPVAELLDLRVEGGKKDPYRWVRVCAAWTLGELGNPEAVRPLLRTLQRPEWHRVHHRAIESLWKLGVVEQPDVAAALEALANGSGELANKARASLDAPLKPPEERSAIVFDEVKRGWCFR